MFLLPKNFLREFVWTQFAHLPYPEGDFGGQTIIVTGANCGLGLEAARHFVRLGASRVILGCRSIQKGEIAKAGLENTTHRKNVVEVWQVDLTSFASVKAFCARASVMERLDIVIENAGIATGNFEQVEGYESTITVNVISTFLMALMLLPKLQETAAKFGITPHLTVVSSDAHQMANFRERSEPRIFAALSEAASKYQADRYNTSKLLEVMIVRELAQAVTSRDKPLLGGLILARTTEVGSRTLFAGAVAGEESHGTYMSECRVKGPSAFVQSADGLETQMKVYEQLLDLLERVEPGITKSI